MQLVMFVETIPLLNRIFAYLLIYLLYLLTTFHTETQRRLESSENCAIRASIIQRMSNGKAVIAGKLLSSLRISGLCSGLDLLDSKRHAASIPFPYSVLSKTLKYSRAFLKSLNDIFSNLLVSILSKQFLTNFLVWVFILNCHQKHKHFIKLVS